MTRREKGVFLVFLFGLLFLACQAYAEGDLTGYYYDPRIGKVVPRVDELTPIDSESYVAGETPAPAQEPVLAPAPVPDPVLEAGEPVQGEGDNEGVGEDKDKDKDKGNNGVGWGVDGNPETKQMSNGEYKKNAGKK